MFAYVFLCINQYVFYNVMFLLVCFFVCMCWFACLFFFFVFFFYLVCAFIACLSPLSVLLSSLLIIYDFLYFTCFCLRHFTTSLGFSNLPLCPVVINILLCDFFCIPDIVKTPEYRNKCQLNWICTGSGLFLFWRHVESNSLHINERRLCVPLFYKATQKLEWINYILYYK